MKDKNNFYITTPIYYPSNKMTLGNCYTTVIADSIARFNKMLGKNVFFLTGTDEHGGKMEKVAKDAGMEIMDYLNDVIAETKVLWENLGIEYDRFIRTTDADHIKVAQEVFKRLYEKGYIYKGKYKGLYCLPCESFWTESQLVDGKCPDCGRDVVYQEEDAYFFKLSEFGDKLIKLYEDNPEFLQPASRVHEMINNFIKPGLQDLCVSRTSVKWGIPVDFDPDHTIYVWIDALSNYLTGIGYLFEDKEQFEEFWPADLHLVGKEIVRFHAIIWPAILMALDLPLPKKVYGHGWLLLGGQKLSKSKEDKIKEVSDPRILLPRYGADSIRYFLLREMPFGNDGNYSTENFLKRINFDLCNDFGNLVNRSFSMTKKYFNGIVPKQNALSEVDKEFIANVESCRDNALKFMEKYDVSKSLMEIFNIFDFGNKYIDATTPWVLAKEDTERLQTVIYNLLEAIRIGTVLVYPFIPFKTQNVLSAFGFEGLAKYDSISSFGKLEVGKALGEVPMLFPRLDINKELEELRNL